jgi:hypothetical protein
MTVPGDDQNLESGRNLVRARKAADRGMIAYWVAFSSNVSGNAHEIVKLIWMAGRKVQVMEFLTWISEQAAETNLLNSEHSEFKALDRISQVSVQTKGSDWQI